MSADQDLKVFVQDSVPLDLAKEESSEIIRKSVVKYENEEMEFEGHFIPSAYFLAKENPADSVFEEVRHAYARKSSFQLDIKAKKFHDELLKYNIRSIEDYYQRIEYYSFHFAGDVQLVVNKDTFMCSEHHFERTYGISPEIKLSVNFNVPEINLSSADNIGIILFDRIYGQGIIKFAIDPASIKTLKVTTQNL